MKTKYLKFIGFALAVSVGLASCSQDFLEAKKNYDQTSAEIFNSYDGADGRVRDVYASCLPNPEVKGGENWQYVSFGVSDNLSKATEEYTGTSSWADYNTTLVARGGSEVPDYFIGGSNLVINQSVYGHIRLINESIRGISNGNLSQEDKNFFIGQLLFFRAWRYFNMWKWYGGVPIVDDVPLVAPESIKERSSAIKCLNFIISDLNEAARLLEPYTSTLTNASNYGRVTMGSALALKGRVLTWWCSPLFNRAQDTERYVEAYRIMKEDLNKITECGYGLYPATTKNAAGWADMFQIIDPTNTEAVFFARLNNLYSDGSAIYRNNTWENSIRPANTGYGSRETSTGSMPAATLVDLFPMKDGKVPNNDYYSKLPKSKYDYNTSETENHSLPFMNRDPRFYRTFGFPGIKWPVKGEITWNTSAPYPKGDDYELWNYVWYETADHKVLPNSSSRYGADNLMGNVRGMYIIKRSGSDLDHQNYILDPTFAFRRSAASCIDIRFAEVLLNLAEVACGAGDTGSAYGYLKQIRERVGYTGDCGLDMGGDQNACMAAVLYERQIELAYEGKRFDDMRRWLLFDGGVNIPGTKLTGWGGDVCSWLGVEKFNGRRRESMEFRVNDDTNNGLGGKTWATNENIPDPIALAAYQAGLYEPTVIEEKDKDGKIKTTYEYFEPFKKWRSANYSVDLNGDDLEGQLNTLEAFYKKYLVYKFKYGDALSVDNNTDERTRITYRPEYYFPGLKGGALDANPTLRQTIGWGGGPTGDNGDFDPLEVPEGDLGELNKSWAMTENK